MLKAANVDYIYLQLRRFFVKGMLYANLIKLYNLSGTFVTSIDYSVDSVGNDWYRC